MICSWYLGCRFWTPPPQQWQPGGLQILCFVVGSWRLLCSSYLGSIFQSQKRKQATTKKELHMSFPDGITQEAKLGGPRGARQWPRSALRRSWHFPCSGSTRPRLRTARIAPPCTPGPASFGCFKGDLDRAPLKGT